MCETKRKMHDGIHFILVVLLRWFKAFIYDNTYIYQVMLFFDRYLGHAYHFSKLLEKRLIIFGEGSALHSIQQQEKNEMGYWLYLHV